MAELTRAELTALSNANFPNNSSELIIPEKHREYNDGSIDSAFTLLDDNVATGRNVFQGKTIFDNYINEHKYPTPVSPTFGSVDIGSLGANVFDIEGGESLIDFGEGDYYKGFKAIFRVLTTPLEITIRDINESPYETGIYGPTTSAGILLLPVNTIFEVVCLYGTGDGAFSWQVSNIQLPEQPEKSIWVYGENAPDTTNDVNQGYFRGSMWKTAEGKDYICDVNTSGNAVWSLMAGTMGDVGSGADWEVDFVNSALNSFRDVTILDGFFQRHGNVVSVILKCDSTVAFSNAVPNGYVTLDLRLNTATYGGNTLVRDGDIIGFGSLEGLGSTSATWIYFGEPTGSVGDRLNCFTQQPHNILTGRFQVMFTFKMSYV